MSSFIHLAAQSYYSFSSGVLSPEALANAAINGGMNTLGVADIDSVAGVIRLAKTLGNNGLNYIPAVSLTLEDNGSLGWERTLYNQALTGPGVGARHLVSGGSRIIFIATNNHGCASLMELTSKALSIKKGYKNSTHSMKEGSLSFADIGQILSGDGLYILFGLDSPLNRLVARQQYAGAKAELMRWLSISDAKNLRIGICAGKGRNQINRALFSLADDFSIDTVINQEPRFLYPKDRVVTQLREAIYQQVPLGTSFPTRSDDIGLWEHPKALENAFHERPDSLHNSLLIGEEACVDFSLGESRVPHFFYSNRDNSSHSDRADKPPIILRERVRQGLLSRLNIDIDRDLTSSVSLRAQKELDLISSKNLEPYFLTVSTIVQRIRDMDILVSCRGSAAGSLITYALRISDVNPLDYGLLMERFLNTERVDLPDIDLDVESHRRDEIYYDLINTFGPKRVMGLAMVETFRARGAIREVGKALSFPKTEIDIIAKSLPHMRANNVRETSLALAETNGIGLDVEHIQHALFLVEQLASMPRGLALHPCGMILSDEKIADIAPIIPSGQEVLGMSVPMIPYNKDDIEDIGLIKIDVLAVRMFSTLSLSRDLIFENRGINIDFDEIDKEQQEAVFDLIGSSDTIGIFQIESPGQRELISRLKPKDINDLIVEISLFRPGPVKGDMITPYLDRRFGKEETDIPPILEHALAETHGVIVFHEQVINTISSLTGCSLTRADSLRRRLKNPQERPLIREYIMDWALRRGFQKAEAESLWEVIEGFASFGFCKAHAASFAIPTYRSAWLKTFYMPEFFAAMLTHDPGMYPKRLICSEARQHGIGLLGIDINASKDIFSLQPTLSSELNLPSHFAKGDYGLINGVGDDEMRWAIRPSLGCVRGISREQVVSVMKGQPFSSLEEVRERTSLSAPVANDLASIGAFDSICQGMSRGDIILETEELWSNARGGAVVIGQLKLFEDKPVVRLKDLPPAKQVRNEIDITGMDFYSHVIDFYVKSFPNLTRASDLADLPEGTRVEIIGAKVASQTPPTKSGKRVIFITLDDGTGLIDVTFFSNTHAQAARTVFSNWLIRIIGTVNRRGELPTILGEKAFPLVDPASQNVGKRNLYHASMGSSG